MSKSQNIAFISFTVTFDVLSINLSIYLYILYT